VALVGTHSSASSVAVFYNGRCNQQGQNHTEKANSWPRSGITKIHSSLDQRQPSTVIRKEFQNSSNGCILRRNAGCVDGPASSVSRTMKLDPRMPYRPTAGLVSLFARTGTNIGASRAPIAREHSVNKSSVAPLSFAASYAQVAARSMHYRKRIKFRGPRYFRRPAHENKEGIFVGLVTDENPEYFRGPGAIFVGGPTKILNIFSSAS
jgi:hypothetical protein